MSEAIITVSNLGKRYRISHQGEKQRYTALRDVIAQKFAVPFKFLRGVGRSKIEDGASTNSKLLTPFSSPSAANS
jgi:lipopolysaccharide transport system ATP-binding protein